MCLFVDEHVESLQRQLQEISSQFDDGSSSDECIDKINCHSGRDCWSMEESCRFFKLMEQVQKQSKYTILHETHRGRILYSPWTSLQILEKFPFIELTADLSHWVLVAERHLDEFDKVMEIVKSRTRHVHARPCSTQHIQLSHLDDEAYKPDLDAFIKYWKDIIQKHRELGTRVFIRLFIDYFRYLLDDFIDYFRYLLDDFIDYFRS